MDELKKRKCRLDDYNFVFELVKESIFPFVSVYIKPNEKIFKKRFEKDYYERIILTLDEKPIGFYQIKQIDQNLEIKGLFLKREFRGKGIGYNLMTQFENKNIKKICLMVWDNNPAVQFYKKLGYKIVEEKDHKYLMEKSF